MIRLSVNVNKVATLRNSRGGDEPSIRAATEACVAAGAPGITVHPRKDERHIRASDVGVLAEQLAPLRDSVEFNIEGDPRPDWIELVLSVKPHQCTLVPVRPGEITSEAGWSADTPIDALGDAIAAFKAEGIRVSVFVEAEAAPIEWASVHGADRVEIYTEPYARAHESGGGVLEASLTRYAAATKHARSLGLGVNAGHDFNLENLGVFLEAVQVDEVSIGHALIARALFVGLERVVKEYLEVIRGAGG